MLGGATALYTIPSLAMFSLLLPYTGLGQDTVIIGLVLYSLTILVRNMHRRARRRPDRGQGSGPRHGVRRGAAPDARSRCPLALPTIMAGIRVATVSTVALTTVGAIVGAGGLGNLLIESIRTRFKAEILTAGVLCVLLAVTLDLLLLGMQRLLTPWARGRTA